MKGVSPSVKYVFFCKSVSFCPSCDKCPQCCRRSACGGLTAKFLASLGPEGFKFKSSIYPEGGVQPSIQSQTSSHQNSSDKERICQSLQGQLPAGGIAFPPSETSGRKSKGSVLSGILQQTSLSPNQIKNRVVSGVGLGREPQEIGAGSQADFQFCWLPVRFGSGSSQAYPGNMGGSQLQDQFPAGEDQLLGLTTHVLDRPSHRDRKVGSIRTPPHEANTVAPEDPLAHPGVLGEGHPDSQVPSPPLTVVVKGRKRTDRH